MTKKRTVPSASMVYGKARPGFAARKTVLLKELWFAENHLTHCVLENLCEENKKLDAARADVELIKAELQQICKGE